MVGCVMEKEVNLGSDPIKPEAGILGGQNGSVPPLGRQSSQMQFPHLTGPGEQVLLANVSPSMTLGSSVSVHLLNVTAMASDGSSVGSPRRAGTYVALLESFCFLRVKISSQLTKIIFI